MRPSNEFCEDGTMSYVMKLLLENMGFKTGSVEDVGVVIKVCYCSIYVRFVA